MGKAARRTVRWGLLGRVPFSQADRLQVELREGLRTGRLPEHLLLLEHPPVYTLGRNARPEDVVAARTWLEARGVEIHECDRGGQVTYHGPGQLVAYPILDLSPDRRDIRRYVRDLQAVLIRTLADFGIEGTAREGQEFIGVWAAGSKIASVGVHISRWLTTHGFALNVTTDLSYFEGIVPCGLEGVEMASLESLTGRRPALAEVGESCARHFGELFERRMVAAPAEVLLQAWATA